MINRRQTQYLYFMILATIRFPEFKTYHYPVNKKVFNIILIKKNDYENSVFL
jgi:hypothetical protein